MLKSSGKPTGSAENRLDQRKTTLNQSYLEMQPPKMLAHITPLLGRVAC